MHTLFHILNKNAHIMSGPVFVKKGFSAKTVLKNEFYACSPSSNFMLATRFLLKIQQKIVIVLVVTGFFLPKSLVHLEFIRDKKARGHLVSSLSCWLLLAREIP